MEIKDVEALAELAKLELTQAEKEKLLSDMEGILDYIKQIEEVEVPDVNAEFSIHNVWREDSIKDKIEHNPELIVGQFPDAKDGFVKVKKII